MFNLVIAMLRRRVSEQPAASEQGELPGSRKSVLKAVHALGNRVCSYMKDRAWPHNMHDCKFGYAGDDSDEEVNGCPELAVVAQVLENMTDEEWLEILSRTSKGASWM